MLGQHEFFSNHSLPLDRVVAATKILSSCAHAAGCKSRPLHLGPAWHLGAELLEHPLYCEHIEQRGESLFRVACEYDLEGIVAKRKYDPYLAEHTTWLKIRNPRYSQWAGREELFEHERKADPDLQGWAVCTEACDTAVQS
jgi:hypothetical protein